MSTYETFRPSGWGCGQASRRGRRKDAAEPKLVSWLVVLPKYKKIKEETYVDCVINPMKIFVYKGAPEGSSGKVKGEEEISSSELPKSGLPWKLLFFHSLFLFQSC